MLGLGWTEMLVIGVVALIVIGPKDLPVVMKRLGQFTGQIRRMGSEFQREINKTTGLDEVRNLRTAITAPLKQTTDQIRKDFNAMTPTGGVKPSGLIKPADPKAESVVAEIHAAAGMTPPAVAEPAVVAKAAAKKAPVRAKAAPTSPVATAELAPVATVTTAAVPAPVAKKAATSKKPVAPLAAAPVDVAPPAASKSRAKSAAPKAPAPEAIPATPAPKRVAAKKPTTAKAGTE